MRLARRIVLVASMALAAHAFLATGAAAEVQVIDEERGELCPDVALDVHAVSGGCHFEFRSEGHITFVVETMTGPVTIFSCDWHLEGVVDSGGSGYVTAGVLTDEDPPATTPCVRTACDEATGEMIPWPIEIADVGGVRTVELNFCLRRIADGPGAVGDQCEAHLPWSNNGGHEYEIGVGATYVCENTPIVSFEDAHFVNEVAPQEGTEDVEILNPQSVDVLDEETEEPCVDVTLSVHTVSGGCHVEFESEGHIPLVVDTVGGPVTLSVCDWHMEALLGADGIGYATAASLADEDPPAVPPCTRTPCDEATGEMIPWPLHVTEVAGVRRIALTLCLRTIASGGGGAGNNCRVHLPWTNNGGHEHEIGVGATYVCEPPLQTVSFEDVHFVNEVDPGVGTEDVEIVH